MDLRDLNFRQFEAFSAVMSAGSITGAAKLLGYSQPTVTRLIREFETTLGFELLHRNGPRISPTERGIAFHQEVEGLLTNLGHLQERVATIREQASPRVHIACTPALAISIVPAALGGMVSTPLPRHIAVESYPVERVIQAVLGRTADLGVSSLPIDHTAIETHWTAEAPCVAAMAVDHKLASSKLLRLESLRSERIIAGAHPYRHSARIDDALANAGLEPGHVLDTNTSITALTMARAGLGVAIIEPATAYCTPIEGVAILPIDTHVPFLFGTITAATAPLSPVAEILIPRLRAVAAANIPGIEFR